MSFFHTIKTGEQAAVWNNDGTYEIVDGPKHFFAGLQRVVPLQAHIARPNQYLVIQYKDGATEHVKGPAKRFFDPATHDKITALPAIEVNASEALVVYNDNFYCISTL